MGKAPPQEGLGYGDFRDGDSSIDDNESIVFDDLEDASSVTTDDSLFVREHDKYMPQSEVVRRVSRRASRGRAPDTRYRYHQRPKSRNLGYIEHHSPGPRYPYGDVDIYPENSMHKRHHDGRPRPALVSYPAVPPQTQLTYDNRRDHHGAPSPHRTQALSPPVRYVNAHFQDDISRDKNWERDQHERERSLGNYMLNKRRQEQETQRRRWGQDVQVHAHPLPPKGVADQRPPPLPREDRFDKYERMAELNNVSGGGPPHQQRDRFVADDAFNDPDPFGRENMNHAPTRGSWPNGPWPNGP